MNTRILIAFMVALYVMAPISALASNADTRMILQNFVDDYQYDPMLESGVFGIRVGENDDWHVVAKRASEDAPGSVVLSEGLPDQATWFFTLDNAATLSKIDRGELAPGTAAVKAFSTDFAPMDVGFMDGFQPGEEFVKGMLSTLFHFWNRGTPEITNFSAANTRHTHGTDAVVLHYEPGFRSGWFSVKPGDHVNADPASRTNEFPSLMVITRGSGVARLNGKDHELHEGQSLYIPIGMSHEFLNPGDAPMEGILLMFGEGA